MAAASILSITLVPVLMGYFVRGKIRKEEENPINRFLLRVYRPMIDWVLRRRGWVIGGAAVTLALTVIPYLRLGSEFMPPLDEGAIMDMPSLFPNVGPTQARRILQHRDSAMASVPEVAMVLGKIGRAETATDAAPFSMIESVAILMPEDEWREGVDIDDIRAELDRRTRMPGIANMWSMPIKNRLDMLLTGIKTPVGVKIFGPDLETLETIGKQIERLLPWSRERPRSTPSVPSAEGIWRSISIARRSRATGSRSMRSSRRSRSRSGESWRPRRSRGASGIRCSSATPGRCGMTRTRSAGSSCPRRWAPRCLSPSSPTSGSPRGRTW